MLVEINCETDFVAKNDSFKAFCDEVAKKIASQPDADLEADRIAIVQKLGENILIRRSARVEVTGHGAVAAYIHTGGKVGVLVEVGADKDETTTTEAFKQLVRDITLQIAAANPISVDRTAVPAATLERERAIYREQVPPGQAGEHRSRKSSMGRSTNFTARFASSIRRSLRTPIKPSRSSWKLRARTSATSSSSAVSCALWSAKKSRRKFFSISRDEFRAQAAKSAPALRFRAIKRGQ